MKNKFCNISLILFLTFQFFACRNSFVPQGEEVLPGKKGVLTVTANTVFNSSRAAVSTQALSTDLVYFGKLTAGDTPLHEGYIKNSGKNGTEQIYIFETLTEDQQNIKLTVYGCVKGTTELTSANYYDVCVLWGSSETVNISAGQVSVGFGNIVLQKNDGFTSNKGRVELKVKTPEPAASYGFNVECTNPEIVFTISDSKIINNSINAGSYSVTFSLYKQDNPTVKIAVANPIQTINVYPGLTTNTWIGSDVNSSGQLELIKASASDEILYVCGTTGQSWYTADGLSGVVLEEGYTPDGTMHAPYKTLADAVNKCTANKDYKIYVDGITSETSSSVFGNASDSNTSSLTIRALGTSATVKAGRQLSSSMLFIGKGRSAVIEGIVFDGDSVKADGTKKDIIYTTGDRDLTSSDHYFGGGICSYGQLTMTNCTVQNCYVEGTECRGAGIAVVDNDLFLTKCTVSNNLLDDTGSNTNSNGAGIALISDAGTTFAATFNEVTISGNKSPTRGYGGGLFIDNYYTCTIKNCVIGDSSVIEDSSKKETAGSAANSNVSRNGGGIYVCGNAVTPGKLVVEGANTIAYNYASENGGGIFAEGSLEMNNEAADKSNVLISYNGCGEDMYGGGIYCLPTSSFASNCSYFIKNCTINNNGYFDNRILIQLKGCYGGGAAFSSVINQSSVDLYNVTFNSNMGNIGGAIWTENGLSLDGDCVLQSNAACKGGAIYAENTVSAITVTLGSSSNPIEIKENTAYACGGAVYAGVKAAVTVENGEIMSNTVKCVGGNGGGAVYIHGDNSVYGSFTFKKGEMSGNKLESDTTSRDLGGGAVYLGDTNNNAIFTMTGGVIKSNTAGTGDNRKGNAINLTEGGKISISGTAYIDSNNDVYLGTGKKVTVSGDLTPKANGVSGTTLTSAVKLTLQSTDGHPQVVNASDSLATDANMDKVFVDNDSYIDLSGCLQSKLAPVVHSENNLKRAIKFAPSTTPAQVITVDQSFSVSGTISIEDAKKIQISTNTNGVTITRNISDTTKRTENSMISISDANTEVTLGGGSYTLTLDGGSGRSADATGTDYNSLFANFSQINPDGTTENSTENDKYGRKKGPALVSISNGTLNINNDCILMNANNSRCESETAYDGENYGGALKITGGTVNLEGKITYCRAGYGGGAVHISSGTLNMKGYADINHCAATWYWDGTTEGGGAIYQTGGTVNILENASIKYNVGRKGGGGVYVTGGIFNMTAGTISNNYSHGNQSSGNWGGAGIRQEGGTIEITGGIISDNRAEGAGNKGGGINSTGPSQIKLVNSCVKGQGNYSKETDASSYYVVSDGSNFYRYKDSHWSYVNNGTTSSD